MSSALAIAGVTAVLKDLLDSGMIDHHITDAMGQGATITALAPDLIPVGKDAPPGLNLFLHQTTPNAAWRNAGNPMRASDGQRTGSPPLAIDLHYLLTAYGSAELQAEVLLGYALLLLHETPVLTRAAIRTALTPSVVPVNQLLPSIYQALSASDLADQIEQIRITPETMSTEEISKLWTAVQSHYRPTAAFQVTVVLIDPPKTTPVRSPLPVLSRGVVDPVTKRERGVIAQPDLGAPFAELTAATPPHNQLAAIAGDLITISGERLADGSAQRLLLAQPRLGLSYDATPLATITPGAITATLQDLPGTLPAGSWLAAVQYQLAGEPLPRTTNQVPLALAPRLTGTLPLTATRAADGSALIGLSCAPDLQPGQRVSLIIGSIEVPAVPFAAATPSPTFALDQAPVGTFWVRLRVDGVDSLLVDRSNPTPVFVAGQQIVIS
jgi:hypothetical protein